MSQPLPSPDKTPRILLTGVSGQLGWELRRVLMPLGTLIATTGPNERDPLAETLDLSQEQQIRELVRRTRPDIIINPAAYTAVDRAEDEPALAHAINARAPAVLAEEAHRTGALVVHYSTDYVFAGTNGRPYVETDPPNPINVYGQTKREGELAVQSAGAPYLILRTSWLYGPRGNNFLRTILRVARSQNELRVVDDQLGSPTWARYVAEATAQILGQARVLGADWLAARSGVYHLTAAGVTSWYQFAAEILALVENPRSRPNLLPIPTADYPTKARRPVYSALDCSALMQSFHLVQPSWKDQLHRVMEELNACAFEASA